MKKKWSGVALLAFPESYQHKKLPFSISQFTQALVTLSTLFILVFYSYTFYEITASWLISAVFVTKVIGLTISILLLQKEFTIDDSLVNRLCSVGKNDCNKTLESQDSKVFNLFSWSELGFIYFCGGILSLILSIGHNFNTTLLALLLMNIPTLLFSFYSVWYQYFKAKSWCLFCLITIFLFWVEAILLWISFSFSVNYLFHELLIIILGFIIPCTLILLLKSFFKKIEEFSSVKKDLNEIKYNDEIVDILINRKELKSELPNCAININGSVESPNTLTIITSPTCPPCAKAHKKLEKYLNGCYDDLSINIMFTINSDKDNDSEKYKVARRIVQIYKTQGIKDAINAMNSWYNDKTFEKWNILFPSDNINVDYILKQQNDWCIANNIKYTPTILFNGRELPKQYNIDDVKYLMV